MVDKQQRVTVRHWTGGQHPSMSNVTRVMETEGLRPYLWTNTPNHRYAIRSHGYSKVIYVIDGSLEIALPDSNELVWLRVGDRIDIPAMVRHGMTVGLNGVKCVEATITDDRPRSSRRTSRPGKSRSRR